MVRYQGLILGKGSRALELYERKEFDKLNKHLKEVEDSTRKLQGGVTPPHLINYRVGDHPEDWK